METNTSIIQISLDVPVNYHMSGKFEAPSAQWMHKIVPLNDFELIVVTRGFHRLLTVKLMQEDCCIMYRKKSRIIGRC